MGRRRYYYFASSISKKVSHQRNNGILFIISKIQSRLTYSKMLSSSSNLSSRSGTQQQKDERASFLPRESLAQPRKGGFVLRLTRSWNIECPPAKQTNVHGHMLPTLKNVVTLGGRILPSKQKQRRLAIEIHGPDILEPEEQGKNNDIGKSTRKTHRRGSSWLGGGSAAADALPRPSPERANKNLGNAVELSKELLDDDRIILRILKRRKNWGLTWDPDDSSSSSEDDDNYEEKDIEAGGRRRRGGTVKRKNSSDIQEKQENEWIEYRKYGSDEVKDVEKHGARVELTVGLGTNQERRVLRFGSDTQAAAFYEKWTALQALVKERAKQRLQAFQENQRQTELLMRRSLPEGLEDFTAQSRIDLLIEVVSATDLPIADRVQSTTAPYVVIYLGSREIHRTNPQNRSLNPIWTVESGAFCLLSVAAHEFFESASGITFVVKDRDMVNKDETLGKVSVPHSTLLKMKDDDRLALPLNLVKAHKYLHHVVIPPALYIRARKATEEDKRFMKMIGKGRKQGIFAAEAFVGPNADSSKLFRRETKMVDGRRMHRVKPCPDPGRPEPETKWLDNDELLAEVMKPTQKWIEAGNGMTGRVYLEILKCDGLPNMNTSIQGKTDAFCCIIYEDAIMTTDVINDTLKPRWVPWCKRGFVLRLAHPSSQILVGVFDYNAENAFAFNNYENVGRISIGLTNLRPNTEYVLSYHLHRSILIKEKQNFGTLTVRLRLEYGDFRKAIMTSIRIPTLNRLNLPSQVSFRMAFNVCHGNDNVQCFDSRILNAYREELQEYLRIWHYIKKGILSIVFWRTPSHSILTFGLLVTLIENFNLLPSYILFSTAWLLVALNDHRRKHPSPWQTSHSYFHLLRSFISGSADPATIVANQNEALIKEYAELNKQLQQRQEERMQKAQDRSKMIDSMLNDEQEDSATEAIDSRADDTTKMRSGPNMNPLAKFLFPVQQYLGQACRSLRIASRVVLWDESYCAFWIVNACVVSGLILLWVPWDFVIRWILRITVWLVFGPWMKLVDIIYIQKQQSENGEDEEELLKDLFRERLKAHNLAKEGLQKAREEILKTRSLKRTMFGRFVTRIPRFNDYRFTDIPLAQSFAKPLLQQSEINVDQRLHWQTLMGHMIPIWGDPVDLLKLRDDNKTSDNIASKAENVISILPISEHSAGHESGDKKND